MTDYHVHIGQFNEVYYDALAIFKIIEATQKFTDITEIWYSSTSSCRDDVELVLVEEEIAYAQSYESTKLIIKPYLWFIPKYAEQGISVEEAAASFNYTGIKLHPIGQNWLEDNSTHLKALHQIFRWADDHEKTVLIHCGKQKCDLPTRFENFFLEYTKAKVILAHSNPVMETSKMVNKYKNVCCDTACISEKNLQNLMKLVDYPKKILFGSDFPVSHYFETNLLNRKITFEQEYITNCNRIAKKLSL